MGIKQSERLTFEASYDLHSLIAGESIIKKDFAMSFIVPDGFPKITVEHRLQESPAFIGFWIYGDGAGITITDYAEIEFELLYNISNGDNAYTQTSLVMSVIDKRYRNDYKAYYNSKGKQLKNIRKRFELLACKAILDLYRYMIKNPNEDSLDLAEIFRAEQVKQIFKEMRVPKRFTGSLT